jgi:hypothetical protein
VRGRQGYQLHNWLFSTRNHNLLAFTGALDESGKLGFRLVDSDGFHCFN